MACQALLQIENSQPLNYGSGGRALSFPAPRMDIDVAVYLGGVTANLYRDHMTSHSYNMYMYDNIYIYIYTCIYI